MIASTSGSSIPSSSSWVSSTSGTICSLESCIDGRANEANPGATVLMIALVRNEPRFRSAGLSVASTALGVKPRSGGRWTVGVTLGRSLMSNVTFGALPATGSSRHDGSAGVGCAGSGPGSVSASSVFSASPSVVSVWDTCESERGLILNAGLPSLDSGVNVPSRFGSRPIRASLSRATSSSMTFMAGYSSSTSWKGPDGREYKLHVVAARTEATRRASFVRRQISATRKQVRLLGGGGFTSVSSSVRTRLTVLGSLLRFLVLLVVWSLGKLTCFLPVCLFVWEVSCPKLFFIVVVLVFFYLVVWSLGKLTCFLPVCLFVWEVSCPKLFFIVVVLVFFTW